MVESENAVNLEMKHQIQEMLETALTVNKIDIQFLEDEWQNDKKMTMRYVIVIGKKWKEKKREVDWWRIDIIPLIWIKCQLLKPRA